MDIYLPRIGPDAYPVFARLPGADLPEDFDRWSKRLDGWVLRHRTRGDNIHMIEMEVDEFSRWHRGMQTPPSLTSLRDFAQIKASRQSDALRR